MKKCRQNITIFFDWDECWLLGIGESTCFDTHVQIYRVYTWYLNEVEVQEPEWEVHAIVISICHIYLDIFCLPYLLHIDCIVFWSWERDSLGILLSWPTCFDMFSALSNSKLTRKHRASLFLFLSCWNMLATRYGYCKHSQKNDQQFPVWMPSHYLAMGYHLEGHRVMIKCGHNFFSDLTGLGTSIRFK